MCPQKGETLMGDWLDKITEDKIAMAEVVQNWAVWRDAGDWERFRTVWHPDAWMSATWFQGPAEQFIAVGKAGFEKGVNILHFLGGISVDVAADRAISQCKMTISQRGPLAGETVDVGCTGRLSDFFERRGAAWEVCSRAPHHID